MGGEEVSIRPYAEGDMWLLERTLGEPSQMVHLNGPEGPEKIRDRHRRYLAMSANPRAGCMFVVKAGNADAGNVGYWEIEREGRKAWEVGWFVLPELQGRGLATDATRQLVALLGRLRAHSFVYAFPSVNNAPSNAIPRKLGFSLTGESSSEYPAGSGKLLRCNVWRLALPTPSG